MRQASLSNGLRLGAIEMPGVRYVSIRLIVGAGSRDEPREKAGINHFVEHLSFAARSAIPTRARFAPASRRVASRRWARR